MHTRLQRLVSAVAAASVVFAPYAVKAVTVTTDLQGELIKGSQPAVYFYGEDHKRYVFPNDRIFFTWYSDFSSVRTITDTELAEIPIGGNVTYRPGTKLVKVTTDPKVYAVADAGKLRWITSEQIARALYGEDWAKQVQDVPDAFFGDYEVGTAIQKESDYQSEAYRNTYQKIEALIAAKAGTEPAADTTSTSAHQIVLKAGTNQQFSWTDTVTSPLGYKVVWSTTAHPTYPTRDTDSYIYLDSSTARSVSLAGKLTSSQTYYVRVCEYLGGKCGAYSNEVSVMGSGTTTDDSSDDSSEDTAVSQSGTITVKSAGGQKISWTDTGSSSMGYKVVYSLKAGPTYPTRDGDTYLYFSEPSTRSATLGDVEAGKTYYVRVCEYLGGKCGVYSNQITVTIAGTSETTSSATHTIVLKSNGQGAFSWTDTANSPMGYKVVYSENTNPTYPTRDGDTYQYYDNPSTRSTTIEDLESGHTYYVRVCEYLGGKCGAYSNQVTYAP